MNSGGKELALSLSPYLQLFPGDEIELELRRWENAFCVLQGIVIEVNDNKIYILPEQAGLRRPQRRKSERVPVELKAEYLLLPKNEFETYREGLIQDISRHGALLTVEEPLALNHQIFLVFEVPTGKGRSYATGVSGKVVRTHRSAVEEEHSYGVEFDSPLTLNVMQ